MKKISLLLLSGLLAISCGTNQSGTETSTLEGFEFFGDSLNVTTEGMELAADELVAAMEGIDSMEVRIRGNVLEVCQTKGCWMDLDIGGGEFMTVRFKDYGFFMPKDIAGREVTLEGYVLRTVEEVDWLRHKAQDAGKSEEEIAEITEPEISYSYMAHGVILHPEQDPGK
jgi:hypothetical protein